MRPRFEDPIETVEARLVKVDFSIRFIFYVQDLVKRNVSLVYLSSPPRLYDYEIGPGKFEDIKEGIRSFDLPYYDQMADMAIIFNYNATVHAMRAEIISLQLDPGFFIGYFFNETYRSQYHLKRENLIQESFIQWKIFYKEEIFEKGKHALLKPFLSMRELSVGGRMDVAGYETMGEWYRSKPVWTGNPYSGMQSSKLFQFNEVFKRNDQSINEAIDIFRNYHVFYFNSIREILR